MCWYVRHFIIVIFLTFKSIILNCFQLMNASRVMEGVSICVRTLLMVLSVPAMMGTN